MKNLFIKLFKKEIIIDKNINNNIEIENELSSRIKKLMRGYIEREIKNYSFIEISNISIKYFIDNININIACYKPGILIGPYGQTVNNLAKYLSKVIDKKINVTIEESIIWN